MYKTGDSCPVCGEGKLSDKVTVERFEYKGQKLLVPDYLVYECGVCSEEFVARKTLNKTEKILTDFRREVDGLLTSEEIKAIRTKLGKTQTAMATLLGVGEKNFARYENGRVTQSKSMDLLLRMIDEAPYILGRLTAKSHMQQLTSYQLSVKALDDRLLKREDDQGVSGYKLKCEVLGAA